MTFTSTKAHTTQSARHVRPHFQILTSSWELACPRLGFPFPPTSRGTDRDRVAASEFGTGALPILISFFVGALGDAYFAPSWATRSWAAIVELLHKEKEEALQELARLKNQLR
jgi:hypothetical protein